MKKGLLFANPKRLLAKFYDPFGIYINEDRHRSICVDSVNQQRTPKIVWDDLVFHDGCRMALQGAGLVSRGRKRGVHRKRRPRRPLPGMLLHIDGSHHRWFQDERWDDLIVIMDDATSEIYYAQLVEEDESAHIIKAQCSTDNTDRNQKVAALAHLRMMWGSSCRINQPARRTSRRRLSKNMRQFFRHAGRNRCPKCQPNDEF